jgi:2,3-bisphosphoglycerate-independent phosphoglycerate mutase
MDWTLKPLDGFTPRSGPLLVVVMDGVGLGPGDEGDAVALARTPVLDWLMTHCPWVSLKAHGTAVGLPSDADMGNSEVGHNALGAGRVFDQGAKLVNAAIETGALFQGETWQTFVAQCREQGSAMHLIGLLSDGNVHSHQNHLNALIDQAAAADVSKLFVHPLLDGRDVPETSALEYVDRLEDQLARYHGTERRTYRIASGGGRMVTTMDRYEADWEVVERGWNAHVHGSERAFASAREAIETYRREIDGVTDQFLPPFVVADGNSPVGPIRDGDVVIFFNFRGDRALEISRAFEQDDFPHFDRGQRPRVLYAGMMEYDGDQHIPHKYLVTPPEIERTLGEYMARNSIRQFACSETQKYGHVTYFWNGNRTGMFDPALEEYCEIPSDRVAFEMRPWMKAAEITDATIERLKSGSFRFGRINYANGDMVGHTGDRRAAILGVESVDLALGRLLEAMRAAEGTALITADHGNSDEMYERDKSGKFLIDEESGRFKPRTSHSLSPVPLILYDPASFDAGSVTYTRPPDGTGRALAPWPAPATSGPPPLELHEPEGGAGLASVAATCLDLLGFEAPPGYAPSLLHIPQQIPSA